MIATTQRRIPGATTRNSAYSAASPRRGRSG